MILTRYRCAIFLVISVLAYMGVFQNFNPYAFVALMLAVWTIP